MNEQFENHTPNADDPQAPEPGALIREGYQALSDNDVIQAGSCFKQALEIDQQAVGAWRGLGKACESAELFDDAMFAFQQSLQIEPRHADTLRRVAAVHIQAQQYKEAIHALETCLDVEPDQSDTARALDLLKQHVAAR
ncbi:MAG: tetratricopeptide repeat protein [Phycisphaerae bacterium]